MLKEQVEAAEILGYIYNLVLFPVKSAHSYYELIAFCWCTLSFQHYSLLCSFWQQTWLRHSPTMREEYLWKGSKGHFPFPSSCFPSSLSCPLANVCWKQKERERGKKEKTYCRREKKGNWAILFRQSTERQLDLIRIWMFNPLTTTCLYLHYYSLFSKVNRRYTKANLWLSHCFTFLSEYLAVGSDLLQKKGF